MTKHFHAHIYFNHGDLAQARSLMEQAKLVSRFDVVKIHEKPVGPHPLAMVEIHFNDLSYAFSLEWIAAHRGIFSVLVHQDTGDDWKDHTDGIRWLGPTLPLDFTFFELIQRRPDLRVHQDV